MSISWFKSGAIPKSSFDLILDSGIKVQLHKVKSYNIVQGSSEYEEVIQQDNFKKNFHDRDAIRRNNPTACYNCHGLTLGNRRGWFVDVELALKEDGYQELTDSDTIKSGDIIAYYNKADGVKKNSHTGFVCNMAGCNVKDLGTEKSKKIEVLSKWGPWGEFIHAYDKNPYYNKDTELKFFRYTKTCY